MTHLGDPLFFAMEVLEKRFSNRWHYVRVVSGPFLLSGCE